MASRKGAWGLVDGDDPKDKVLAVRSCTTSAGCGIQKTPLVDESEENLVSAMEFPWVVSVQDSQYTHLAFGCILSHFWILSIASALQDRLVLLSWGPGRFPHLLLPSFNYTQSQPWSLSITSALRTAGNMVMNHQVYGEKQLPCLVPRLLASLLCHARHQCPGYFLLDSQCTHGYLYSYESGYIDVCICWTENSPPSCVSQRGLP